MEVITLDQCPKFQTCSAPICPLDPDWHKRKHLSCDRCCFYLLEAAKTDSNHVFECAGLGKLHAAIVTLTPAITNAYSHIKHAVERAKSTGSRMLNKFGREHEQ
jgi:hypothetical protein